MSENFGSTFDSSVQAVAEMLRKVVESARSDRDGRTLPEANSTAMRAFHSQPMFPNSDEGPIDVCRSLASMCLRAGEDHVLAYCQLLKDSETQLIWPLTVLARAGLEAFANARHLTQDGISDQLRCGRAFNELIHSIEDTKYARGEAETTKKLEVRKAEARKMGLNQHIKPGGKSTNFFEENRPNLSDLVQRLVDETNSKERTPGLGQSVYKFWSQVAHSTGHGLASALGQPTENPITGTLSAPSQISVDDVMVRASILYSAHLEALKHSMTFNGWPRTAHLKVQPEAERLFFAYFTTEDPEK
jgi:hypothetical protein